MILIFVGLIVPELKAETPLADPTRPPDAAPAPAAVGPNAAPEQGAAPAQHGMSSIPLRVSATILAPKANHAIINGITVTVGDKVFGFEVKAIERGRVIVRRNDEEIELGLSTATQSIGDIR